MIREPGHSVTVMAKPALVIVDDEDATRHALARELESRYGAHYRIVAFPSPETALARLTEFRAEGSVAISLVHDYLALALQTTPES